MKEKELELMNFKGKKLAVMQIILINEEQGSRKKECRFSAGSVRLFSMRSYWFLMIYMNLLKCTVSFSVYNIPTFCAKYMTSLI